MSTHLPAPASSTAVVWQPLCSPSAHHLFGASTTGLPVSIVGVAGEPLASNSSLWVLDSASAHRPSGSTMVPSSLRLRLGLSSSIRRLGTPLLRCASSLCPSGSVRLLLPSAPPQSSVALAPPRPSGSPPPHQSFETSVPPWSSGSSSSPWLIGSPSQPQAPPPPAPPPLVGPLESSALPLHDSSLRRLHRGSPLRLWPGSHLALHAPSPSCLLPGSSLLHNLPGLCLLAPSRVCVLPPSLLPRSHLSLPLLFNCERTHL